MQQNVLAATQVNLQSANQSADYELLHTRANQDFDLGLSFRDKHDWVNAGKYFEQAYVEFFDLSVTHDNCIYSLAEAAHQLTAPYKYQGRKDEESLVWKAMGAINTIPKGSTLDPASTNMLLAKQLYEALTNTVKSTDK